MRRAPYLPVVLLVLAACGSSSSSDGGLDAGAANIAVIGAWDDNYGNTDLNCAGDGGTVPPWCYWAIDDTLWGEDTVVSYDNTTESCVTQEYAFSPYGPGTYNKIFWTPADGGFWWCNSAYGQTSYDDALNSTIAVDATHPWDGGCPVATDGGDSFSWTYMSHHTPDIAILGDWKQADGGSLDITATGWGADSIVWYSNTSDETPGWAVTKTTLDGGSATYNLLEWNVSGTSAKYCSAGNGLASAEAAQDATDAGVDASCVWSTLTQ